MAVTVVATVGGASSNSYVLVTEVDTFAERTPYAAAWAAEAADDKAALVVQATEGIERLPLTGRPMADTQSLWYPVTDAYRPSGNLWATDAIPQPIKDATSYLAAWLASLASGTVAFKPSANANLKRKKSVDVLGEKEFLSSQPSEGDVFLAEFIAPRLRKHGLLGASGTVRLRR